MGTPIGRPAACVELGRTECRFLVHADGMPGLLPKDVPNSTLKMRISEVHGTRSAAILDVIAFPIHAAKLHDCKDRARIARLGQKVQRRPRHIGASKGERPCDGPLFARRTAHAIDVQLARNSRMRCGGTGFCMNEKL
jgi:hypothetical protein